MAEKNVDNTRNQKKEKNQSQQYLDPRMICRCYNAPTESRISHIQSENEQSAERGRAGVGRICTPPEKDDEDATEQEATFGLTELKDI